MRGNGGKLTEREWDEVRKKERKKKKKERKHN